MIASGVPTLVGAPLALTARLFFARRSGDIDNRVKPLLDALQYAGVFEDDALVSRIVLDRYLDRDNPRAEVEIDVLNSPAHIEAVAPSLLRR